MTAIMTDAARARYGKPGFDGTDYMKSVANSAPMVGNFISGATPFDAVVDIGDGIVSFMNKDWGGVAGGYRKASSVGIKHK